MSSVEDAQTNEKGDLSNQCDDIFENISNGSDLPTTRYIVAPEFISRSESYDVLSSYHRINGENSFFSLPSQDFKSPIFHSTMFLHAYERPSDLPRKDPQEAKRHRIECDRIMKSISKRHHERLSQFIAEQEKRVELETASSNRLKYWRHDVIPKWKSMENLKTLFDDWWLGIPSSVRPEVWQLIIGNPLGITRELFDGCLAQSNRTIRLMERQRLLAEGVGGGGASATLPARAAASLRLGRLHSLPNGATLDGRSRVMRQNSLTNSVLPRGGELAPLQSPASSPTYPSPSLSLPGDLSSNEESSLQVIRLDVSRTFPMLGSFQTEGLHTRNLHDLLAAFVAYQPSLGYLQGMSFIAGILLIVFDDIFTAFVAFAALMNRPSFYAFYSLDESEFAAYFGAFDALLEKRMPRLAAHLKTCRLESKLYLFDWLFTIFSRSLPLEVVLRIWDLFLRDGEPALLLAALGILHMYEERLLFYDFDHLASFLTGPMPESMSPDLLTSCMRSLDLSNSDIKMALSKARKSSNYEELGCTNGIRSAYDSIPTTLEVFDGEEKLKKSESFPHKWRFLGRRNRNVKPSQRNSSETNESAKSSSLRRKSYASDVTNYPTTWSKEVCLDFPKRDML